MGLSQTCFNESNSASFSPTTPQPVTFVVPSSSVPCTNTFWFPPPPPPIHHLALIARIVKGIGSPQLSLVEAVPLISPVQLRKLSPRRLIRCWGFWKRNGMLPPFPSWPLSVFKRSRDLTTLAVFSLLSSPHMKGCKQNSHH